MAERHRVPGSGADDMISLSTFQAQEQGIANLIQQTVAQFVVRPSGEQGAFGVSGFVFDIIDREEFGLHSEITDNFVENNSAVQDHIALHPERFTLRGFVGELREIESGALGDVLNLLRTIQLVQNMEPVFSIGAEEGYTTISEIAEASNRAISQVNEIYSIFAGKSTTLDHQQNAYNYFYALWKTRQLCTVETPWGILGEMAIEEVSAVQDGETRFISEFSVTFKKIRIVQTQSIAGASGALPVINAANQQDSGILADSGASGGGAGGGGNINIGGTWPPTPPSSPSAPNYGRYANVAATSTDKGVFSSLTADEIAPARILGPMFALVP